MKVELNDTELAKIKANSEMIDSLSRQLNEIKQQLTRYVEAQQELEQEIRERIDEDLPETDMRQWNFRQVDWLEYEGKVLIPDEDGEENG